MRPKLDRDRDDVIWKPQLRLTRWHWNQVEDLADALRRHGAKYRPGPSPIIAGILDATLPPVVIDLERPAPVQRGRLPLAGLVARHLKALAIGEAPAATRLAIAAYVRDVLERDAVDRLNRAIRGQQRSRSRKRSK